MAFRRFMQRGDERRMHPERRERMRDALVRLDTPGDIDLPGFPLHPRRGVHTGFRAVTVRASRRVNFRFQDGQAADVDDPDCHPGGRPMPVHDPPHPRAFIRRRCLEPLGLTVTEAVKGLSVSRNTLSLLLDGRLGVSPEMAVRPSQAFGGSPESWLTQQVQYDPRHARHKRPPVRIRRWAASMSCRMTWKCQSRRTT